MQYGDKSAQRVYMQEEIWKDIVGFEGRNQVSNLGRVYSQYSRRCMDIKHLNHDPYLSVVLTKCGKSKPYRVHRLVAMAFLENPAGLPCVNHIDTNKTNNLLENLEWVTYGENSRHAVASGVWNPPKGERQHTAVLTAKDVLDILTRLSKGEMNQDVVKDYSVGKDQISKIKHGKCWSHIPFDRSIFSKSKTTRAKYTMI